jgi:hypothetical protein
MPAGRTVPTANQDIKLVHNTCLVGGLNILVITMHGYSNTSGCAASKQPFPCMHCQLKHAACSAVHLLQTVLVLSSSHNNAPVHGPATQYDMPSWIDGKIRLQCSSNKPQGLQLPLLCL